MGGTATGPGQDAVRLFFDSGAYLERNAIIPVRAHIVQRFLGDLEGSRVLDLGCGDGSISRPLLSSHNQLTLVDFSEHMLENARAATELGAPVDFVRADLLDFMATEPYDAVICVGVLAHVPSVDEVVGVVAGALRPGGRCVLQITDDSSRLGWLLNRYYRWRNREQYDMRTMTERELLAIARRHELVALQSQRYGLLLPGMGRLPYRWECRAEMAVAEHPTLSHAGAEMLVSMQKLG